MGLATLLRTAAPDEVRTVCGSGRLIFVALQDRLGRGALKEGDKVAQINRPLPQAVLTLCLLW
jgi:hypothetical protein